VLRMIRRADDEEGGRGRGKKGRSEGGKIRGRAVGEAKGEGGRSGDACRPPKQATHKSDLDKNKRKRGEPCEKGRGSYGNIREGVFGRRNLFGLESGKKGV